MATECAGGGVSIAAENVPLEQVLSELGRSTGMRTILHVTVDRTVSVDFNCQPLSAVIRDMLVAYSYLLYEPASGDADTAAALWIFSEGESARPPSIDGLEAGLLHGNPAERKRAIRELRDLATPAASAALSLALADDDHRVRRDAMSALRRIGSEEALAALSSSAMNNDAWEREQATIAMSAIDGASAREYLRLQFDDVSPRVRAAAVDATVDVMPRDFSLPLLAAALSDADAAVRLEAVDALEALGGEGAASALRRATGDEDPAVRRASEEALRLLQSQ